MNFKLILLIIAFVCLSTVSASAISSSNTNRKPDGPVNSADPEGLLAMSVLAIVVILSKI